MKNSDYTIGNRTRDLPVCSAVTQPTAPTRRHTPMLISIKCFVLPILCLNHAVNRYLPGYDLDLLGPEKCHGSGRGLHNAMFTANAKIGSYSWALRRSKFD